MRTLRADATLGGMATHHAAASQAAADPFAGVRFADVGDARLAYRERGAGPPVVLVHGSASDLRMWDGQLGAIGATYRAIALSRRYARPNDDIPAGLDDRMPRHVDDLLAFLDAVDAAPAHLAGHSWGAFICLLAAIRRPQAVRSLVLQEPPVLSLFVSTPPRPGELARLAVRRPRTALAIMRFGAGTVAPAQRAFRRGDDEAALTRFACGVLGRDGFARLGHDRRQQARENIAALRAQLLGEGFPSLDAGDVSAVRAPTLLMTGQRSPRVLLRLSEALAELLPRAEHVEIAGASHAFPEERPAEVNSAVLGFLARCEQRTAPRA